MGAHQLQPPVTRRDGVATVKLLLNLTSWLRPLPLLRSFNLLFAFKGC